MTRNERRSAHDASPGAGRYCSTKWPSLLAIATIRPLAESNAYRLPVPLSVPDEMWANFGAGRSIVSAGGFAGPVPPGVSRAMLPLLAAENAPSVRGGGEVFLGRPPRRPGGAGP